MPVRIKICGITRAEDAKVAASLGADALGFIFCPTSPRFVEPAEAARIIAGLPPFVSRVGVFLDADLTYVKNILNITGIDTVQLHGGETPEYCAALSCAVVKAFGVDAEFDIDRLAPFRVNGYLLDTWDPGVRGGTGRTFDWTIARKAQERHGNVILAGGLNPQNVEEAVEAVRPWAVDLNSGVEIHHFYEADVIEGAEDRESEGNTGDPEVASVDNGFNHEKFCKEAGGGGDASKRK